MPHLPFFFSRLLPALLLVLSGYVISLSGQALLSADTVSVVAPLTEAVLLGRNQFRHTGSETTRYQWRKIVLNQTPGWTFAVCDTLACHPPAVDRMELEMLPAAVSRLDVQAFPDRIAGAALEVAVELTDLTTGATQTAYYLFSNQTSNTTSLLLLEVSVFPNPTADRLTIDARGRSFRGQLHDARGQLVRSFLVDGITDLDLSPLPDGLYILRLATPDGFRLGRRIIKQ